MQVDVGLKFHVRSASGKVDVLLIDAPSALIGTAAHCEVRLPNGGGAHEHVEVLALDGVVHLTARRGATPPLLDGAPFVAGTWAFGSVLTIGDVAMTVEPVDLRQNVKKRSPFWLLALVPAAAALAAVVSSARPIEWESRVPPAPGLFDPPVATCPSPHPPAPMLTAFAAERARLGYAKRERSPFARADGIEAVGLLEVASACYQAAGQLEPARETRAAAASLRNKLEEEYRVRCVRVEHAVLVHDHVAAKRELLSLLPLTAHRRGPYFDWLASTDRRATTAIEQSAAGRLGG